jgi:hypothetical protein
MISTWSGHQENTSGQQIARGPANHRALEQLQAVDVPFNRPLTPRQRHPGFHGGRILTQSFGNAPEGWQGARGGTTQPGFERGRLALADEAGEVWCERYGLRQCGRLRGQLRQRLVSLRRRPCRRTEDQPGRPARRERAPWRLCQRWEGLVAAALPGGSPLGLAPTADRPRHTPVLALTTLVADHPEEVPAMATPAVPAGQEGGCVRSEEAAATAMARGALGDRGALQRALPGAPTEPHRRGHGIPGPALPLGHPTRLVGGHPRRGPRGGEGRGVGGGLWGREGHGGTAGGGGRVGGIGHRCWCRKVLGMTARHRRGVSPAPVGQHVRAILPQRATVGHLTGRGCPEARRFGRGLRAIPDGHLDARMGLQPRRHSRGLAVGAPGPGPPPGEVVARCRCGGGTADGGTTACGRQAAR